MCAFKAIDSLQVMTYIIQRCDDLKIDLNITKLQRLMYCCYGVVLAGFGRRLIDEYPVAWIYGPVFPESLRAVQYFKINAFRSKRAPDVECLPKAVRTMIDDALRSYGKFSALQLSQWSTAKGSPWRDARGLYWRVPDQSIELYFSQFVDS